ncbi:hypothetical protein J6590_072188 [Homalodisca vitripennis]|nr:hypothetical protein J6590_072188 [Homalodisca vitripennis]
MSSVGDVVLAAAACVILSKKRKPKRYWIKRSLRARSVYSGSDMLNDLQEDDIDPLSDELRCDGSIKNFLRMASSDFEQLIIEHLLVENKLNLLNATALPGRKLPVPYLIVADDAFPMQPSIMKTYPGLQEKGSNKRVYNYR